MPSPLQRHQRMKHDRQDCADSKRDEKRSRPLQEEQHADHCHEQCGEMLYGLLHAQ